MGGRLQTQARVAAVILAGLAAFGGPACAAGRPFCVLAVEETVARLAIVSPGGEVLKRVALGERPHEIEVTADGRTAYVSEFGITDYDSAIGTPGRTVAKVDLVAGARVGEFRLPEGLSGPHGVRLRPGHARELFVNAEVGGEAMVVFDTASGKVLRRFPLPAGTHNFVFSKDGAFLVSFAGAKGVAKIDALSGKVLARRELGAPVRGVALSRSGTILAGARESVVELRASDLSEVRRLTPPAAGQVLYLEQMPDGSIFAPQIKSDGVTIFPPGGGAVKVAATGTTPIRVARGPDGLVYVANVEDEKVGVLGADGEVRKPLAGIVSPNGLAFGACPRP